MSKKPFSFVGVSTCTTVGTRMSFLYLQKVNTFSKRHYCANQTFITKYDYRHSRLRLQLKKHSHILTTTTRAYHYVQKNSLMVLLTALPNKQLNQNNQNATCQLGWVKTSRLLGRVKIPGHFKPSKDS